MNIWMQYTLFLMFTSGGIFFGGLCVIHSKDKRWELTNTFGMIWGSFACFFTLLGLLASISLEDKIYLVFFPTIGLAALGHGIRIAWNARQNSDKQILKRAKRLADYALTVVEGVEWDAIREHILKIIREQIPYLLAQRKELRGDLKIIEGALKEGSRLSKTEETEEMLTELQTQKKTIEEALKSIETRILETFVFLAKLHATLRMARALQLRKVLDQDHLELGFGKLTEAIRTTSDELVKARQEVEHLTRQPQPQQTIAQ